MIAKKDVELEKIKAQVEELKQDALSEADMHSLKQILEAVASGRSIRKVNRKTSLFKFKNVNHGWKSKLALYLL